MIKNMEKKIKVNIPSVPDHLILDIGGDVGKLHISKFTEEDLRMVGKEWTEELVRRSKVLEEK